MPDKAFARIKAAQVDLLRRSIWSRLKRLIDQGKIAVCADCRRPYTKKGLIGPPLTDSEFALVQSHGLCPICDRRRRKELKAGQ